MKKITGLIFIYAIMLTLVLNMSACQTFSPEYEIKQHPLIDKIWSVSAQQFIPADNLNQEILKNNIILLGETHDNARHHQLQAQLIAHLAANHHTPAVAYEMLNQNQQHSIDKFQAKHYLPVSADAAANISALADAFSVTINWEKSGWPEWDYYRPVFYTSIDNKLPIIAANLDIKTIRNVIKKGSTVLDQVYQEQLLKYQYGESLKKELQQEILSAHCNMLPEKMLSPMLLGQQVRDLAMTQAILSSVPKKPGTDNTTDKVVLIAGSGHTRTDHGIPYYLHQEAPALKTISIAFIEVSKDEFNPDDYAQAWSDTAQQLPFDYAWFTAKAEREDQCEKMKVYMKKKG